MAVTATATLMDDKMKFACTAGAHSLVTDYTPPYGGGNGPTSLELFLASLCSCLGGSMAVLLRHGGRRLNGITVSAAGTRRETHPTSFEHIDLQVHVQSPDVSQADIDHAVTLSEERFCPVAAMIKGNVSLTITAVLDPVTAE